MIETPVVVKQENGLDGRPIALLVQEASQYASQVFILADDELKPGGGRAGHGAHGRRGRGKGGGRNQNLFHAYKLKEGKGFFSQHEDSWRKTPRRVCCGVLR